MGETEDESTGAHDPKRNGENAPAGQGCCSSGEGLCPLCLEARLSEGCPPGPSGHSLSQELEPRLKVKGLFVWGW